MAEVVFMPAILRLMRQLHAAFPFAGLLLALVFLPVTTARAEEEDAPAEAGSNIEPAHADDAPFWYGDLTPILVPDSLLWKPPLANQREPRMTAQLDTALRQTTIDTAIGGEVGLIRLAAPNVRDGFQMDLMAVVFTRFDGSILYADDYRVGFPLTWSRGPWSAKIGFEHSSSHVGDEFIENHPGVHHNSFSRNEVVVGLSRKLADQLRLYGQIGFAFGRHHPPGGDARYDFGVEWMPAEDVCKLGRPYTAIDVDMRPEQGFAPNTTVQIGWLARNPDTDRGIRYSLEYYHGRSPFGKFYRHEEHYVGIGFHYDW